MIVKYKNKRGRRIIKNCEHCKQSFETLKLKDKPGREKFCSSDCYQQSRKPTEKERLERHKLHQKKHKYGLSPEQYYKMIEDHGNSCAICSKEFLNTNRYDAPCVDHCHQTNIVRGLLCHSCNKGIGHFLDNVTLIEKAVEYLKQNF